MTHGDKLTKVYLNNVYYSFVCDHVNIKKTSNEGLASLSKLIVQPAEAYMQFKFLFAQAYSCYIQHKFSEAIELFEKILKLASLDDKSRFESTRYLIECYMCEKKKEEALKLVKTSAQINPICDLLIRFYSESTNLAQLYES